MPFSVDFHPPAVEEARAARKWYGTRSTAAAAAFVRELAAVVAALQEAPLRWPAYLRGTRKLVLRRFPFLVVYRVVGEPVLVVAVAHGHRKPGYWRSR
jgi:plasmid stabilization system protein ParE